MSESDSAEPKSPGYVTRILRGILAGLIVVVLIASAWLIYAYATTPEAIRYPASTHYHFRMQIVNDGSPINFAEAKYQTAFNNDVCTAALTNEPAHFHDGLDQFVHVHWDHLNGGTLLKNYGWDFIAGTSQTLGYRFDQLPSLVRVPIHGLDLPQPPPTTHFYVYVSSVAAPSDYHEQSWDDFLSQDLKDFFALKPAPQQTSWLHRLVPRAWAHDSETHGPAPAETQLAKLNNVLGNVVIFAQADRPTDRQIKDRFAHLVALPESSCGG